MGIKSVSFVRSLLLLPVNGVSDGVIVRPEVLRKFGVELVHERQCGHPFLDV